MRKNFLTIGTVISIAWISLAPLSLLFVANIASSRYPVQIKLLAFFVTLFSWILLPLGTGLLWKKESRQVPAAKKNEAKKSVKTEAIRPESFREEKPGEFAKLCLRLFEKMWRGVQTEGSFEAGPHSLDHLIRLHQKSYLVRSENRRTFFDSRDVEEFSQEIKKRGALSGYFFTTGLFSDSARQFAEHENIELIDGQKLGELLSTLGEFKDFPSAQNLCEKRRYARIPCSIFPFEDRPVLSLSSIYQRTVKLKAEISNISVGGLCLTLPSPEKLPTFFQLTLSIPSRPEGLRILGEVVWQRFHTEQERQQSGISFASMTEENRESLNDFLAKRVS